MAWSEASAALRRVQSTGQDLEKVVRGALQWTGGRVVYDSDHNYDLQVDALFPDTKNPKAVASVTYTDPDSKGHSNENKLHLKVGELALLKNRYPDLRAVLVVGGTRASWLSYVLKALEVFFDEVVYLELEEGRTRLRAIRDDPSSVSLRNEDLWANLKRDWAGRIYLPPETRPPTGLLRYRVLDDLKTRPRVGNPNLISNPIARECLVRSYQEDGQEWDSYLSGKWHALEMSRSYFNPLEATVEILLRDGGLAFLGGVAHNVQIRSLLHDLGMKNTRVSEDFVLASESPNRPVYVQCKASGGGRAQHGKAIQNRAKEQIARSLLYSCRSPDGKQIEWRPQSFRWVAVLDGDWGCNRSQPLKYLHMLQLAGYTAFFGAEDLLVRGQLQPDPGCRFLHHLRDELGCLPASRATRDGLTSRLSSYLA